MGLTLSIEERGSAPETARDQENRRLNDQFTRGLSSEAHGFHFNPAMRAALSDAMRSLTADVTPSRVQEAFRQQEEIEGKSAKDTRSAQAYSANGASPAAASYQHISPEHAALQVAVQQANQPIIPILGTNQPDYTQSVGIVGAAAAAKVTASVGAESASNASPVSVSKPK